MSLRDVLALPRKVLRREKGRMEMMERMGERSWIWKWACERGSKKKTGKVRGKNTSISRRLSRYSFRRRIIGGELSRATSRIRTANAWPRERRRGSVPERRALVCVAHFSGVSANRRTIPKSPGSRSRMTSATMTAYCHLKMIRMTRRVLTPPLLDISFNVTVINVCRADIERRYLIRLRHGITE